LFDLILKDEWNTIKEIDDININKKKGEKRKIENNLRAIEKNMLKTNISDLYEKLELERSSLNAEKKVIEEDINN
jgi:hypothetical protein